MEQGAATCYGHVPVLMKSISPMLNGCFWAFAALAMAGDPDVPGDRAGEADRCLEQFNARHPWIECRATFEPDAQAKDAISEITSGMIRDASCHTNLRLERKGLVGTYLLGGVLQLQPHDVFCDLYTEAYVLSQIKITVAPKVTFLNKTVTDVSLGIVSIADLPPFVVAPVSDATESTFVRRQLAKALNAFLRQALAQ
jgi:hypothetical protein